MANANAKLSITFPAGRLVQGSVLQGFDKDDEGNPLVWKSGKNKDQPRTNYVLGVAIPKGNESSWQETEWGEKIVAFAAEQAPDFYDMDAFAWKIDDGDSTKKMQNGKRRSDNPHLKNCWLVRCSANFAPSQGTFDSEGNVNEVADEDFIKKGYYVQVAVEIQFNGSSKTPGIYLNHTFVVLDRKGEVIEGAKRDPNKLGFKKSSASETVEVKKVTPDSEARKALPVKKSLPVKKTTYALAPDVDYSGTMEQFLTEYDLTVAEAEEQGYLVKQ